MQPNGGTEILYRNLKKHIDPFELSRINLILSICDKSFLSNHIPNVLWQHLSYDQQNVFNLNDPEFTNNIDYFVFVSKWQHLKFIEKYNIPLYNSRVIRNAIDPIQFKFKPNTDKLKLIYTSTPWRGLEILIEVMDKLKHLNIELDVYSSTIIYGKDFMPNAYDYLFDKCKSASNINYKGYASNNVIRKAVQESHIFAYPSIFEETSCMSAIEAGAAGCKLVLSDFGALTETCQDWASYVEYKNKPQLVKDYSELLEYEILSYWKNSEETEFNIQQQSDWFNNEYAWSARIQDWYDVISIVN